MSDLDDLKISNLVNLTGRIALITGGGTGIGLMIAKGFAANGVKVYITGRREEVLHQVHLQYPNIQPLRMDVTNKEEIANAVKVIEEEDGKLDILVNNAGDVGPFYSFSESAGGVMNSMPYALAQDKDCDQWSNSHFFNQYDFEHWANVFNLNTTAPFFVTMAFLDLLKKGAASRKVMSSVIMISSIVGGKAKITYNIPAYSTSKAGVEHLTVNLATEFARNEIPIRVNCIVPGTFPSQLAGSEEEVSEFMRAGPLPGAMNRVPLCRAGSETEMASIAIYLASSMSGYTNGNLITVDGGVHLVNP